MTNQDIETFFAVLDHGTMTAAAPRRCTSPSRPCPPG